ncbi:MAG: aminopeptidase P family protein [Phascolarctobacterium sp.]|uniref:aminopeptidase P family protein n=1 Tax=Phascolarctobacterium sp. TaxID=2049039 RepID=UPI0026DCF5F9|nr:aminopeptidase P family protein [Phascolarctobacterium sp.]MDO4921117.1 aminopeptidase P family protein [Phascolarctobacterium sp.]
MTRINKVLEIMARMQVDSVIIKDVTTIRYLTGFTGDSSLLYLDRQQGVLITDGRYTEQAKHEMKLFKVLEYTPVNGRSIWEAAAGLTHKAGSLVIGFDGACYSYNEYVTLQELVGETPLESIDLSAIRMIKDKKELDLLVKAASIADEAFNKLLDDIQPGRTERSLAGRLEYYMRALGSEKTSFDTIVASGARSALPHGMASDKVVEIGDFITFDFGAVYQGYHSDMTRTLVLGMANSWQKEIYTIVEEAQLKGLKAARTGMTGRELDAVVRKVITDCGYGDYYVHGTGHGVGLEIHEMPNINKQGATVLQTGMIFTIEPGIYIPGKGGVRIEDTVVLTEEGARALNGVKKQLIEIV